MASEMPSLILLVDDDETDNFFHERAIRKAGYTCQIDVCVSGDDALDYLYNRGEYGDRGSELPRPDLIFLDINMPRVDGWEFLAEFEQQEQGAERGRQFPIVVMLSTSNDPKSVDRARSSPLVSDFIVKPLRPEGFQTVVKTHLAVESTV